MPPKRKKRPKRSQAKKSKNETVDLPDEVVLNIFTYLPVDNLKNCRFVCTQWRLVALDSTFDWHIVDKLSFTGFKPTAGETAWFAAINHVPAGPKTTGRRKPHSGALKSIKDISETPGLQAGALRSFQSGLYIELFNEEDEEVSGYAKLQSSHLEKCHQAIYNMTFDSKSVAKGKIWRAEVKASRRSAVVKLYVNFRKIETLLRNGVLTPKNVPNARILFRAISRDLYPRLEPLIGSNGRALKEQIIPAGIYNTIAQPESLAATLYNYQLNAVSWMKYVEDNCRKDLGRYAPYVIWGKMSYQVCFDLKQKAIYPKSFVKEKTSPAFHGGVLGDEMGLGKTVSVIALTLISEPEDFDGEDFRRINGKYYWNTNATLVAVPNQLAQQWIDEYKKYSKKKLKIIKLTTVGPHGKKTHKDLVDADIVVVSHQFLSNKNYLKRRTMHERTSEGDEPKSQKSPNLNSIYWRRIVLDEGHEKLKKDSEALQYLQSEYKWYVTGTPFPSEESIFRCCQFLSGKSDCVPHRLTQTSRKSTIIPPNSMTVARISGYQWSIMQGTRVTEIPRSHSKNLYFYDTEDCAIEYDTSLLIELLFKNFVWRHTKDSVQDEMKIPPYKEQLELLSFHPIQRLAYEYHEAFESRGDSLAKMCSMLANTNLHAAYNTLGVTIRYRIQAVQTNITQSENTIKNLEARARVNNEEYLRSMIKRQKRSLDQARNLLESLEEFLTKHNAIAPKSTMKSIESKKFQIGENAVDKCTSIEDLISAIEFRGMVPVDRESKEAMMDQLLPVLKKEQKLYVMKYHASFRYTNLSNDEKVLLYGTKFGAMLQYMEDMWTKEPSARIILFSRFTQVLASVKRVLCENGILSMMVQGNVFVREKAIKSFKSDSTNSEEYKVLLMSSEKAASGTNLMNAKVVILLDPVSGTHDEVEAQEGQAIGRCYRMGQSEQVLVLRFLVDKTVEHYSYLEYKEGAASRKKAKKKQASAVKARKPLLTRQASFSGAFAGSSKLMSNSLSELVGLKK